MAADDPRRILRLPGRLSFGATDLTAVWPHGGTGLGATKGVQFTIAASAYPITSEAKGGEPVEYLEPGVVVALGCTLRTFEGDAVDLLFRNTAAGAETQRQVVSEPSTVRAGNWMSGRGVLLVFTPEGMTQAQSATAPDVDGPMLVLYRAVPLIEEQARLDLERGREFGIPVIFRGIRDSSGRIYKMGPRADISIA